MSDRRNHDQNYPNFPKPLKSSQIRFVVPGPGKEHLTPRTFGTLVTSAPAALSQSTVCSQLSSADSCCPPPQAPRVASPVTSLCSENRSQRNIMTPPLARCEDTGPCISACLSQSTASSGRAPCSAMAAAASGSICCSGVETMGPMSSAACCTPPPCSPLAAAASCPGTPPCSVLNTNDSCADNSANVGACSTCGPCSDPAPKSQGSPPTITDLTAGPDAARPQRTSLLSKGLSFLSSPLAPPSLPSFTDNTMEGAPCMHSTIAPVGDMSMPNSMPTEHQQRQVSKCRQEAVQCGGDAARINGQLNEIFIHRLQDIDLKAEGDADMKLVTYQEWVDMLLQINEVIISNMEDLESEVVQRLELMKCKAASECRQSHQDQSCELSKYRQDICSLLKVIQNGYHHNDWNMFGLQFKTMTPQEVLGVCECGENERSVQPCPVNCDSKAVDQQNKLIANIRALTMEVATKHDEVCELKKQLQCMEDEIQNAQKKIQLKDDVIKELRNDLRCAQTKPCSSRSSSSFVIMPPINVVSQRSPRSCTTQVSDALDCNQFLNDNCSQFESLSNSEQLEQEKLKELEDELNELFAMTNNFKKQNLEYHRKRLSDIFQKSEAEKAEAYRKLDHIRRQLIDLEATSTDTSVRGINDCDSGFSSKSENDQDAKILEAVRRRLRRLNECAFEMKTTIQKLEIENNELGTCLESEKCFGKRNSDILKELADLLCRLTGKQFSYKDIYNAGCEPNPFCEAVMALKSNYETNEEKYICALNNKDIQFEDLQENQLQLERELHQMKNNKNTSATTLDSLTADNTNTDNSTPDTVAVNNFSTPSTTIPTTATATATTTTTNKDNATG